MGMLQSKLRAAVMQSLRPAGGIYASSSRQLALELRLRTQLGEPYLDPRDLAVADGFSLCPHPVSKLTEWECPWGGSDGAAIDYYWHHDPRTRGLCAAFGLASGILLRDGSTSFAERWALAVEILFPTNFRGDGHRLASQLQVHAPEWLAEEALAHPSGVYVRPPSLVG